MNRLQDLEKQAIQTLKIFEPSNGEPYYLCYSGGKDSDCIRILAQLAGVKHECKHNLTTVDAPETVRYVRETIGRENIDYPETTMWKLIVKKLLPPTRLMRYCCSELKERGGKGRVKITGVRKAESVSRKRNNDVVKIIGAPKTTQKLAAEIGAEYTVTEKGGITLPYDNDTTKRMVEYCYQRMNTTINPVVDWEDSEVWEFLNHYGCKSNPLYQCGKHRIGCIGCPMNTGMRRKELAEYPKYRAAYVRAFDRMLEERTRRGRDNTTWRNGEDVMMWWLGDDPTQLTLDKYLADEYQEEIEQWEWENG